MRTCGCSQGDRGRETDRGDKSATLTLIQSTPPATSHTGPPATLQLPTAQSRSRCAAQRSARSSTLPARAAARARAAPKRELERDGTAPATWEMPPRSDASASGGEGAQNLSLLQYAFTVILTSHRVDGSIESSRRRRAFDSIARLRRVDCLYADSILLQIESIDCSYRLDRQHFFRLQLLYLRTPSKPADLTIPMTHRTPAAENNKSSFCSSTSSTVPLIYPPPAEC